MTWFTSKNKAALISHWLFSYIEVMPWPGNSPDSPGNSPDSPEAPSPTSSTTTVCVSESYSGSYDEELHVAH